MGKITVNKDKCKGCLLCISACPKGLLIADQELNQRGANPVKLKAGDDCLGCGLCAIICPDCCIEVYK